LVGVALKLTRVPEQIVVPGVVMIDTAGVSGAVIVIAIWLLLAVAVVAQLALLVIVTLNTSPLLIAEVP
jgi:TctA family transporter